MSDRYNPAIASTTGNDGSPCPLHNDQPRIIGIVPVHRRPERDGGEHTEGGQYTEQPIERPYFTHVRWFEMQFTRSYQFIQGSLKWLWAGRELETDPNRVLVSIDPNVEEVLPKEIIAQANRDYNELRNIQQALEEKTEECTKIRDHWQAAVGELSDLKSSKQTFMVDDAEMAAKWSQLQYSIKNFARTYLRNLVNVGLLTQYQTTLIKAVSPVYQQFLETEGEVHLLFQSMLWMLITDEILRDPTVVWGEQFSAAFKMLLQTCPQSEEQYHNWRADTGQMIQNGRGIDNETYRHLQREISNRITQFVPKEKSSDKKHREIILRNISGIIDKAFELAVIFNQSRCKYRVRKVAYRETFRPEMMDHSEERDVPQVGLMVSPVLIKYGNSKGENYDQRLVLAKSYICSLKPGNQKTEKVEQHGSHQNSGRDNKGERSEESANLIDF
ncbi:hypothetical protein NUW58_g2337 [Xylaria curta]|uniref:Uncharacterized protein n=1 Tax=Xylaria curta TaxID=42375 RepID=A0ACC1PHM7_9PEZI|nr:hypothetical protein NUW58_g2337 [Xylaria curta]